jgi:hypothetical protein
LSIEDCQLTIALAHFYSPCESTKRQFASTIAIFNYQSSHSGRRVANMNVRSRRDPRNGAAESKKRYALIAQEGNQDFTFDAVRVKGYVHPITMV